MSEFEDSLTVLRNMPKGVQPKVRFTYFGSIHDGANIEGVVNTRKALGFHLQGAPGRTNVWLESSTTTVAQADFLAKQIKPGHMVDGLHENWLIKQLKRPPTYIELLRRKSELGGIDLSTNLQVALDRQLVDPEGLRFLFEYKVFDDHKDGIDIVYEGHEERRLKRIKGLRVQSQSFADLVFKRWDQRNPNAAIAEYRESRAYQDLANNEREQDIFPWLSRKVQSHVDSSSGGSIFMTFGPAHEEQVKAWVASLSKGLPVEAHHRVLVPGDMPMLELARKRGQREPDLVYAQTLLQVILEDELRAELTANHKLAIYARNYEGVMEVLAEVVRTQTLDDIRSLCVNRFNPLKFLEDHPIGNQLFITNGNS